ncbi:MAG: AAA family ATPase [Bradymonadaceae bacterium]
MKISIPPICLVLLVGPSGSGKSTFAARHFSPTEIVSSDRCRALISDDETNQHVSADAFELLHLIVDKRLKYGRLAVVDATNLQCRARRPLIEQAEKYDCPLIAIVFDYPTAVYHAHNKARHGRRVPPEIIEKHVRELSQAILSLEGEGVAETYRLRTPHEAQRVEVVRPQIAP